MSLLDQAKVHIDRGEMDQAINCLTDHLNTNFNDDEALFMLGAALITKGKHGLAAAVTWQAIGIRSKAGNNFPEALLNLGTCFRAENDDRAAEKLWLMALDQEDVPAERSKFFTNLGGCYINAGNPLKALAYYDQAIKSDPKNLTAIYNRGLAYLELGRWEEGWHGYETGFKSGDRRNRTYRDIPVWDGASGQSVIVWGEQGVGDEILFASCLPDMLRRSKRVIFDCHPRLVALFKRSFPDIEIYGTRKTLSGVDWVDKCGADASVCISSLPAHFRKRDADFPGTPYLKADLRPVGLRGDARQRIGISWSGGTKKTRQDLRSIPLEQWAPILKAVNADFYSLQYTDNAPRELCDLEEKRGIHVKHLPSWVACRDYDRTASFVSTLDLVITVNTTVHHLAGALGVPCWTLTPSKPAWRYGLEGERCPWYGSAKIIRQKPGQTWEPVIQRVAHDLADL